MCIEIWTDGGCHGNPGPGGWAFVIVAISKTGTETILLEKWGNALQTTNNRMELCAVIAALEEFGHLKTSMDTQAERITVVTDSEYVKNGITVWIHDWKLRGWLTSGKKPVKNQDLWQKLDALASALPLAWRWVKGHSGNRLNERCDNLTQIAIAACQ